MLIGLTEFLPELNLTIYDNLEFIIRIIIAGGLGALIGFERGKRMKGAGMRTHCIIAMSSAAFMILSKYAFVDCTSVIGLEGADPARIAANVVSGITFLGAGVIFRNKDTGVRGLTTAAGIWGTTAVGLIIGSGLYVVGIALAILILMSQYGLHKFRFANDAYFVQSFSVTVSEDFDIKSCVEDMVKEHNGIIDEVRMKRDERNIEMTMTIRSLSAITQEEAMNLMLEHKEIRNIHL